MSNYTKSTNFATKDNLAAGNALKRVKGAEIDDEFNSLATAIATKANSNNTALTGVPTAPTATAGTSTTQIATTAYTTTAVAALVIPSVTAAVVNALAYPVGSIYTAVVATNPATLLGVGVWAAFGAGRVMLGAGGGYTAGNTGGSTTDSHSLSVNEIPPHTHGLPLRHGGGNGTSPYYAVTHEGNYFTSNSTGGGAAHTHDIMQPYIVVYMWQRTS
ncbi:hypothetical protein N9Q02_00890 [bacterium]|nr:hypothetical protein [bacterium]